MGKGDGTVYDFEPKHTFECKNNILSGITLVPWLKILGGDYLHPTFPHYTIPTVHPPKHRHDSKSPGNAYGLFSWLPPPLPGTAQPVAWELNNPSATCSSILPLLSDPCASLAPAFR